MAGGRRGDNNVRDSAYSTVGVATASRGSKGKVGSGAMRDHMPCLPLSCSDEYYVPVQIIITLGGHESSLIPGT